MLSLINYYVELAYVKIYLFFFLNLVSPANDLSDQYLFIDIDLHLRYNAGGKRLFL